MLALGLVADALAPAGSDGVASNKSWAGGSGWGALGPSKSERTPSRASSCAQHAPASSQLQHKIGARVQTYVKQFT